MMSCFMVFLLFRTEFRYAERRWQLSKQLHRRFSGRNSFQIFCIEFKKEGRRVFVKLLGIKLEFCILGDWLDLGPGPREFLNYFCMRLERSISAHKPKETLVL